MMKPAKPTPEDPTVKAKRLAEEARADKANLEANQDVLRDKTRKYQRRFGFGGSQPQTAAVSLSNLFQASMAGGGGIGGGFGGGGGGRGGIGGGEQFITLY